MSQSEQGDEVLGEPDTGREKMNMEAWVEVEIRVESPSG